MVGLDVTDEASIYAAVDEALTAFGRIDVVVNPAVRANSAANGEMNDADLRARFETDFFGSAAVAHAVLPVLREQRGGRFVQIVAHDNDADNAAERAAQAALTSYLEALGSEAACDGVDVDIVEPGAMLAETIGRATADASRTKPSARVVRLPARPEAA
ncbi:SDR family NAD(P)-dependent oxidoreductase [Rudaea sp.]|uniref:SDR family NAD(P)-dependent oxidoreductase n=1 Tax=Rudaea sp. TaxID=2136325 RepID=UPI002ED2E4FC